MASRAQRELLWWAGTDPANGACRMLWGLLVSISLNQQAISALTRVIYEQRESRSVIKLNVVALVFTLFGFAAFLLAMAAIVVLPLILSPIGFGNLEIT
jgi:membrane protein